VTLPNRRNSH